MAPWCLVGNGGMDPYSSPCMIPKNNPQNPFPPKQGDELESGIIWVLHRPTKV